MKAELLPGFSRINWEMSSLPIRVPSDATNMQDMIADALADALAAGWDTRGERRTGCRYTDHQLQRLVGLHYKMSRPDVPDEIMAKLNAVQDEAREDGEPVPSDTAVEIARDLLPRIYRAYPMRYGIYHDDGDVVVDMGNAYGSVLVFCDDFKIRCYAHFNHRMRYACYDVGLSDTLPDGFFREALTQLATEGSTIAI